MPYREGMTPIMRRALLAIFIFGADVEYWYNGSLHIKHPGIRKFPDGMDVPLRIHWNTTWACQCKGMIKSYYLYGDILSVKGMEFIKTLPEYKWACNAKTACQL